LYNKVFSGFFRNILFTVSWTGQECLKIRKGKQNRVGNRVKIWFFTKILTFYKNFDFLRIIWLFTKILTFYENFDFLRKFWLFTKILTFYEHFDFRRKFRLIKNSILTQKFCEQQQFWTKIGNFKKSCKFQVCKQYRFWRKGQILSSIEKSSHNNFEFWRNFLTRNSAKYYIAKKMIFLWIYGIFWHYIFKIYCQKIPKFIKNCPLVGIFAKNESIVHFIIYTADVSK